MKEKLIQIEQLMREVMDEATNSLQKDELSQFMQAADSILNSLEIAESVGIQDSNDSNAKDDIVEDLYSQMNESPIFKRFSENTKAVLVQKMVNDGKPLAEKSDLIEFVEKKLTDLPTDQLVQKAYSKDEIIRIGKSVLDDDVGDGLSYSKGLEILTEESLEPDNLNRVKALAIENMVEDPKSLNQLIFEYYEI